MSVSATTQDPKAYGNFFGGADSAASEGKTFISYNPTTGEEWGTFADSTASDVDAAVQAAQHAFLRAWGRLSPTRRGRLLMRWGTLIAQHADRIATLETGQNGKLFAEMRAQLRTAEDWLLSYAEHLEKHSRQIDRTLESWRAEQTQPS